MFKKSIVCPECRTRGAVKSALGRIRCRNVSCRHYDSSALHEPMEIPQGRPGPTTAHQGAFDPGADGIRIRYRNFRGDETEFFGDRRTVRFTKAHMSIRVAPTGTRISLWQKFVQNLGALKRGEPAAQPTGVERQILGYHRKRGTTSPRYEALRRKYPNWNP
jgi:hypothetical protein